MAESLLHAMAGMCCGFARGLLRLHCAVAQGPASRVLPMLLVMVARSSVCSSAVRVLLPFGIMEATLVVALFLLGAFFQLLAMARSMLLYDLPCAGLATFVGAPIFVL